MTSGGPPPLPPSGGKLGVKKYEKTKDEWLQTAITEFKKKYQKEDLYPKGIYDFGWWCAYFWKEAKSYIPVEATYDKGLALLTAIYGASSEPGEKLVNDIKNTTALVVPPDDAAKKRVLQALLNLGFEPMDKVNLLTASQNGQSTTDLFKEQIKTTSSSKSIVLGYRGEGRDFAKVLTNKGALNRVDCALDVFDARLNVKALDKKDLMQRYTNIEQAWHPWSESDSGGKMYYRITSGDNCLYTVTSVADDPSIAIGFPLIEDENMYSLPEGKPIPIAEKPITEWDRSTIETARKGKVYVVTAEYESTTDKKATGYFLGTESFLYCAKLRGDAVHTENIAKSKTGGGAECRERGIRAIPICDFLAGFQLQRVHHGPNRTRGISGFTTKSVTGSTSCKLFYKPEGLEAGWQDYICRKHETHLKPFAAYHFEGDQSAAKQFLEKIDAMLDRGKILPGEEEQKMGIRLSKIIEWGVKEIPSTDKKFKSFNLP
jgi:hypothetical protein